MYKKVAIIMLMFFLSHTIISAQGPTEQGIIIYEYTNELTHKIINFQLEEEDVEEKAVKLFTFLTTMDYNENQIKLIPDESTIKEAQFNDGHLKVLFNDSILNYGGNTYEYYLINQLLFSFFSIHEVETISFYLEDRGSLFTEGTVIIDYSRNQFLERIMEDESQ